MATPDQLLVVIDPRARRTDGEAVRIAKDVLSAGAASTKVCLPEGPEEFARALSRRGSRRPVVIGDDHALLRTVALLHRQRELAACALSLIPVGSALGLARSLGVPTGAVAAARAALDGVERRLDLLVDDSDGVVLGTLRIPVLPGAAPPEPEDPADAEAGTCAGAEAGGGASGDGSSAGHHSWLRAWPQSLVRTLSTRPARASRPPRPRIWVATGGGAGAGPSRLRVEVDGVMLVDLDQPVEGVSITPGTDGGADVEVRPVSVGAEAAPLHAIGHRVTVSGADFRYRADSLVAGPVRTRTWTVREGAWGLTLPE
ncbi:acylglycerol kinase family protein [Streptomyces sp. DSM 40750]|uniref:acylglycerol kinase family protein n=1 Tax=Streptomyces sp. DSM 40750 TaxID=2801030 RepID=UPI00214C69D3|nr:acylglycerol kinase family protein [Streptomyces sp. DSM 40750]UUU23905.1 acylglycerol kinase family protein [Streptomyces sp. DSM 40750]